MTDLHIIKSGSLYFPVTYFNGKPYVWDNYYGYKDKQKLIKDVKHTLWFIGASLMYNLIID